MEQTTAARVIEEEEEEEEEEEPLTEEEPYQVREAIANTNWLAIPGANRNSNLLPALPRIPPNRVGRISTVSPAVKDHVRISRRLIYRLGRLHKAWTI